MYVRISWVHVVCDLEQSQNRIGYLDHAEKLENNLQTAQLDKIQI